MKNSIAFTTHSPDSQEAFILQALDNVQRLIFYKLGDANRDWAGDLSQRIFYKIWVWHGRRKKDLTPAQWQKLINKIVNTEIAEFFAEKSRREIPFSQFASSSQEFSIENRLLSYQIEGNFDIEICSLYALVWKSIRSLGLKQRYVYLLSNPQLLTGFVINGYSTKEIADLLEVSEKEMAGLLANAPVSDEQIRFGLMKKFNQKFSAKTLWEFRSKTKTKFQKKIRNFLIKEVSKKEVSKK